MPNPADLGKSSPSKHRWQLLLPTTLLTVFIVTQPVLAQANGVEQRVRIYLNRMFAPSSEGIFVNRNGTLHRMTTPLIIAHAWPTCDESVAGILDQFEAKTSIHIDSAHNNLNGPPESARLKFSIFYMEFPDFNAYAASLAHEYMQSMGIRKDFVSVDKSIKRHFEYGSAAAFTDYSPEEMKSYLTVIMPVKASLGFGCGSLIRYSLFKTITNFNSPNIEYDLDDLDFSFIRAINDPSIDANEAEDHAKEKLFILMTNDLKGRNNAEPR